MRTYRVYMEACIVVEVADPDDLERRAGDEHRQTDLETAVKHLGWNRLVNGYGDASRIDGWADLPAGAVTMQIDRNEVEVLEIEVDD
jgi:hypothetical protein